MLKVMQRLPKVEHYTKLHPQRFGSPSSQSDIMLYIAPAVRTSANILTATEREGTIGPL